MTNEENVNLVLDKNRSKGVESLCLHCPVLVAQCNDPWSCLAVYCSEIRRHEGELVGKECIILCVDVCLRAEDNEVGDTAVEGIVSIVTSVGV